MVAARVADEVPGLRLLYRGVLPHFGSESQPGAQRSLPVAVLVTVSVPAATPVVVIVPDACPVTLSPPTAVADETLLPAVAAETESPPVTLPGA